MNVKHHTKPHSFFFFFRDGSNQQLGGCMRDFRNRPHPIRAKVRYYNKVLTVGFLYNVTPYNFKLFTLKISR